jgi:hypothetical protein
MAVKSQVVMMADPDFEVHHHKHIIIKAFVFPVKSTAHMCVVVYNHEINSSAPGGNSDIGHSATSVRIFCVHMEATDILMDGHFSTLCYL